MIQLSNFSVPKMKLPFEYFGICSGYLKIKYNYIKIEMNELETNCQKSSSVDTVGKAPIRKTNHPIIHNVQHTFILSI